LGSFQQQIRDELRGKDCVIIGSPDVSDYAEVVLADLHGIPPHSPNRTDQHALPFVFTKKTKSRDHTRTGFKTASQR